MGNKKLSPIEQQFEDRGNAEGRVKAAYRYFESLYDKFLAYRKKKVIDRKRWDEYAYHQADDIYHIGQDFYEAKKELEKTLNDPVITNYWKYTICQSKTESLEYRIKTHKDRVRKSMAYFGIR